MGFVMPHITMVLAIGVAGLALLLQIVGLATTGWVVVDTTIRGIRIDRSSGLWKTCSGSTCYDIPAQITPDSLFACRAFGVLGVLAIAASALFGILITVMSEKKNLLSILAPAAAAAGAFCTLIEFAVFAGENSGSSDYLGYSFALTIVAFILCLVATVLFFFGRSRTSA